MTALQTEVAEVAERTGFSGAVRVDREGDTVVCAAYGLADRAHGIPATVDTQFAMASGTKSLTAVTVMALVEQGTLRLDTTARSLLGEDLPLVGDGVTVEHLLAHRSGIGDYLDEGSGGNVRDYALTVPVHELATSEAYLRVLDGRPSTFAPGKRFTYNTSGFVLLAVLAERAAGTDLPAPVSDLVCDPAGMPDTAFLRTDSLPGRAAVGYLDATGLRTNVLHLPVRGSGDGGTCSTLADLHALWSALLAGRSWRRRSSRSWCARAVTGRRRAGGTVSACTSPPLVMRSSWRGMTPASPSSACINRRRPSRTRSWPTGPRCLADDPTPRRAAQHLSSPGPAAPPHPRLPRPTGGGPHPSRSSAPYQVATIPGTRKNTQAQAQPSNAIPQARKRRVATLPLTASTLDDVVGPCG
ncbi:MAG: serine hydrolase [Dermatophilaceae bacterium]